MAVTAKDLLTMLAAVEDKDKKSKETTKAKPKSKSTETKKKTTDTSKSKEKPLPKPDPPPKWKKPPKPKDNTKMDPTNPDSKTRSTARKCLDKIEKCVRKDKRWQQEVGTVPPGSDDKPAPVVVPNDADREK